jgi:hypothetical protein
MATPFAAGAAALVLSWLAQQDYKYFGRGMEVREFLKGISPAPASLASTGTVVWGGSFVPNGVIDWSASCAKMSSGFKCVLPLRGKPLFDKGKHLKAVMTGHHHMRVCKECHIL